MGPFHSSRKARALQLLLLVLLLRPLGNLLLAYGMRHLAGVLSISPVPYVKAMANPFVAAGILMLVVGLLVRMALLSIADLSYVLPLTASGYVISSVLGWLFLHEQVSAGQWMGTLLIFAGAAMVGGTKATTTEFASPGKTHTAHLPLPSRY